MNRFIERKVLSEYERYEANIKRKVVYFIIRGFKKRFLGYNDNFDSLYNNRFGRSRLDGFLLIKKFKKYYF